MLEKKLLEVIFRDTICGLYSYIKSDCKTISIAFDNNKGNLLDLEKEFDIISSDGSVLKMLEEKIKNESYNAKK